MESATCHVDPAVAAGADPSRDGVGEHRVGDGDRFESSTIERDEQRLDEVRDAVAAEVRRQESDSDASSLPKHSTKDVAALGLAASRIGIGNRRTERRVSAVDLGLRKRVEEVGEIEALTEDLSRLRGSGLEPRKTFGLSKRSGERLGSAHLRNLVMVALPNPIAPIETVPVSSRQQRELRETTHGAYAGRIVGMGFQEALLCLVIAMQRER